MTARGRRCLPMAREGTAMASERPHHAARGSHVRGSFMLLAPRRGCRRHFALPRRYATHDSAPTPHAYADVIYSFMPCRACRVIAFDTQYFR